MKGSKPHVRLRWSPAGNGWTGNCAASNSPFTSNPTPAPPDEKQWNSWKNMLAKPFKELPEDREDHSFQVENLWQLRDVSGQHLRPSAPPINTFRTIWSMGCQGVLIMQNDPKHSALNEPVKGGEGSCDRVTVLLKCWMKFKVAKREILHVVEDTALTLQASKPSFDIAQTSNKQVSNFCWP